MPDSSQVRVLIVEQNPILLEGIALLIRDEPGIKLVGTAATAEAALILHSEKQPDFTVIDLDLPMASGLELIRRIRVSDRGARIVGLALYELDHVGLEALAAGAIAILAIDQIAESLVPLIRTSAGA